MGRFRFQKPHLLLCSMTWLCVSKCVVTVDGGIVDCEGTVNIVHNFARVCATRPSEALIGKLIKGTATDWVSSGHLRSHELP